MSQASDSSQNTSVSTSATSCWQGKAAPTCVRDGLGAHEAKGWGWGHRECGSSCARGSWDQ
eukprot:3976794-Prymnesium_polylepis.1